MRSTLASTACARGRRSIGVRVQLVECADPREAKFAREGVSCLGVVNTGVMHTPQLDIVLCVIASGLDRGEACSAVAAVAPMDTTRVSGIVDDCDVCELDDFVGFGWLG